MLNYTITAELATLSETQTTAKELNLVKWDIMAPKLDLRVWRFTKNGKEPARGVTLTREEAETLAAALQIYLDTTEPEEDE